MSTMDDDLPQNDSEYIPYRPYINITEAIYQDIINQYTAGNTFNQTGIPLWIHSTLVVIGLMLNCVNIIVFSRPGMKSAINTLLTALEGINIVVYLTFIPELCFEFFPIFNTTYPARILDTANTTVEHAAVFASNWVTLSIAVCRWIAVTFPFKVERICRRRNVLKGIFCIIFLAIGLFAPMPLLYAYEEQIFTVNPNSGPPAFVVEIYYDRVSSLTNRLTLVKMMTGCILSGTIVPVSALFVVSIMIAVSLFRAKATRESCNASLTNSSKKERRITLTLLFMVCTFLMAYVPASIMDVMINVLNVPGVYQMPFIKFVKSRMLISMCNAFTFIFYCAMCEKFRGILKCWGQFAIKSKPRVFFRTRYSDNSNSSALTSI